MLEVILFVALIYAIFATLPHAIFGWMDLLFPPEGEEQPPVFGFNQVRDEGDDDE